MIHDRSEIKNVKQNAEQKLIEEGLLCLKDKLVAKLQTLKLFFVVTIILWLGIGLFGLLRGNVQVCYLPERGYFVRVTQQPSNHLNQRENPYLAKTPAPTRMVNYRPHP